MMSRSMRAPRLGWLLLAAGIWAPLPALALSFDAALQLAEQHTPILQARAEQVEAARYAAVPAGELPDPKLLLGLQNVPLEGDGRYRLNEDGMSMQMIGLMQDVPSRAKRQAEIALASAGLGRAEGERAAQRLLVRQAVAQAWLLLHGVERKRQQLEALVEENRLLAQSVEAQLAGGSAPLVRAVAPRQEQALLDERLDELVAQRQQLRAALRRWLGEAGEQPLQGEPPRWGFDPHAYRQRLAEHPQLALYQPLSAEAAASLQAAVAERQPDWSWELGYQRRGQAYGDMLSLQLSIDLPVFGATRQTPRIAASQARLNALEAERQAFADELAQQLSDELAEHERLWRALDRTRRTLLPLADERLALSMSAYRAGSGELDEVLAARRERIEQQLREIDLTTQLAVLEARLHLAYGEQP